MKIVSLPLLAAVACGGTHVVDEQPDAPPGPSIDAAPGTPDAAPVICDRPWVPLTTIDDVGDYVLGLAGRESPPQAAFAATAELRIVSVHDDDTLTPLVSLAPAAEFGEGTPAQWIDVAATPSGFAALGRSEASPYRRWISFFEVDASGVVARERLVVDPSVEIFATDGETVVVVGGEHAWFYRRAEVDWSLASTRDLPGEHGLLDGVVLDRDLAIVSSYLLGVHLVPLDAERPVTRIATTSHPQRPFRTELGWLIPETSNFWVGTAGAVSRLDLDAKTLVRMSYAPVISAADGEDGPFDGVVYEGLLYLANNESGLLTTPFVDDLAIPLDTDYTSELWPGFQGGPQRLARVGDLLFIANGNPKVGVAKLCPTAE